LVIFSLASGTFTFLLDPVMNLWSRHNEYEADRFAVATTGDSSAMCSSLIKLTRENLNNLAPHPAYSFYHYSHPTTVERVDAIQRSASGPRGVT
jgi:STE24 endopeptidase